MREERRVKGKVLFFGAFLSAQKSYVVDIPSSVRSLSLCLFGGISVCVCLWVMYTVSELTTSCRRAVCLRQPHTESVVMLFYGSWELLTNSQSKGGGLCVCKGAAGLGGMTRKEWGEREDKGKRTCLTSHLAPLSDSVNVTWPQSHGGGALSQTDRHTHTHRHTDKFTETLICLRLLNGSLQHLKQFITHYPNQPDMDWLFLWMLTHTRPLHHCAFIKLVLVTRWQS